MRRSTSNPDLDQVLFQDVLKRVANVTLFDSGKERAEIDDRCISEAASERDELLRDCRQYLQKMANADFDERLRQKIDPSDLVQSALLQGTAHFGSFRGKTREDLFGWLAEVMRNEIRMARRRFLKTQQRNVAREVHVEHPSWLPTSAEKSTPSQQMMRAEEHDQLMRAIDQLPIDYQTVLRLRNWRRLPFIDIGEQMGRSEDAATKLWGRAVLALQKQLDHADSSALYPDVAGDVGG